MEFVKAFSQRMELTLDFNMQSPETVLLEQERFDSAWKREIYAAMRCFLDQSDCMSVKTSGSTGPPKTIEFRKTSMLQTALLTSETFSLPQGTVALLCLPPSSIAGLMMVVRALVGRWRLVCVAPSLTPLLDLDESIDFAAMTPIQAQNSIVENLEKWNRIKKVIIGGAVVSADLERSLTASANHCFITYGMTETLTHIAVRPPGRSHFKPLKGVQIQTDATGCLSILAPHLDGAVITKDIGTVLEDGSFLLHGRIDNVINSGGVKIHPEELEKRIEHLFKCRFYITSATDANFGQLPVLVIEGTMPEIDKEKILDDARAILGKLVAPRKVVCRKVFDETESGKVIRWKNL